MAIVRLLVDTPLSKLILIAGFCIKCLRQYQGFRQGNYILDSPQISCQFVCMKDAIEFPETLTEAVKYFADGDTALNFMASVRWPDGNACCPRCAKSNAAFLATRKLWKCRECYKQFSVKAGIIFEDSALGFDKWLPAFWMMVNAKNGISSCELSRALGVTQKTAWFMLHRIRLAMQNGSMDKLSGEVEVDETYIGGKARSMNNKQRSKRGLGSERAAPAKRLSWDFWNVAAKSN
jgi:transposase-like protein